MKLTLTVVAAAVALVSYRSPRLGLLSVLVLGAAYLAYGLALSAANGRDLANDVPNALRVVLASASGFLLARRSGFLELSASVVLFVASLALNDEYQRRTFDSVRKGRRGGQVVLLGIDGSGKSTHSAQLEDWFRSRGYYCTRVPFHRYLFVDALSSRKKRDRAEGGAKSGGNPLRPLLSAFDNIALDVLTSFGRGIEGRVVIYDRYVWSTYVKYRALGYPVRPVRWLYMLPRPKFAVVLDVPVGKSLGVIGSRPDHIRYREDVLAEERSEYLRIAEGSGFPVVDSTRDQATVQADIERLLAREFPAVVGRP